MDVRLDSDFLLTIKLSLENGIAGSVIVSSDKTQYSGGKGLVIVYLEHSGGLHKLSFCEMNHTSNSLQGFHKFLYK